MKILFVDFSLDKLGGVERVVSTLANSLVDKYDVDICSVYKHSKVPFYEYNSLIRFHYLIDVSDLPSTNSKSKVGFYFFRVFEKVYEQLYYKQRIKRFCDEEMKDKDVIIFCRTTVAMAFLPHMKEYSGKVIVRDANHLYHSNQNRKKILKEYFPSMVDTFIVSSEESKEIYRTFFGETAMNIEKVYNPLGIVPQVCDHSNCKTIVGVGRYVREKGFENLLYAYSKVKEKHSEWSLELIGAGEDYSHYKKICKKLQITDCVHFRKSENIVEEYNRAGIFVMSSRGEGYANALVEAMACGVPVISYNWYVGVEDIIEHSKNGLVVPLRDREKHFKTNVVEAEDVDSLANAICILIEDKEYRKKLGDNARKIIESRKSSQIVEKWIKIIEE